MPKAYWITFFRDIKDPKALAAYAEVAIPVIEAGGGRTLARGLPALVYDNGIKQRTTLIEFDSVAQAQAVHDSPAYQRALALLGDAVDREIRVVEGVG